MEQMRWLAAFEIGVPEIDSDHRALLTRMRGIQAAVAEGDFTLGDALLENLVDFAAEHFRREEDFLDRIAYPGVGVHRQYHADLLVRADSLRLACNRPAVRGEMADCVESLFAFLIDDIINGDLRYKSHLEHKGLIQRTFDKSDI